MFSQIAWQIICTAAVQPMPLHDNGAARRGLHSLKEDQAHDGLWSCRDSGVVIAAVAGAAGAAGAAVAAFSFFSCCFLPFFAPTVVEVASTTF